MLGELTQPARYLEGLAMMTEVYHRGGLTMLGDQGFPQVNKTAEKWSLRFEMWRSDAPYRFALVPNAMFLYRQEGSAEAAEEAKAAEEALALDPEHAAATTRGGAARSRRLLHKGRHRCWACSRRSSAES